MIFPSDPDYLDTKLVKKNVKQLDPAFQKLAHWINERFNTQVLNIYYDKIKEDKNRPRLNIIFEYYESAEKFKDHTGNYDAGKQSEISARFRKILNDESNRNKSFFTRLFQKPSSNRFDTNGLLVIFTAFQPIAKAEVNERITQSEIEVLKQEINLKDLWEISRFDSIATFFFYNDKQIAEYSANGIKEMLEEKYFTLLKCYDEFGYFDKSSFSILLDSKENFDNNFQGNWYYYYK